MPWRDTLTNIFIIEDCESFWIGTNWKRAKNISSQIEHAITSSFVHVLIFYPTYEQSRWYLDEHVLVKDLRSIILPLFYKVEPCVVCWMDKDWAYAETLRHL